MRRCGGVGGWFYMLVGKICHGSNGIIQVSDNMLIFGFCKNCHDPSPCGWDTYKNKIYGDCLICLPLARCDQPVTSSLDFTATIKLFMTQKLWLCWPTRQSKCRKYSFHFFGKSNLWMCHNIASVLKVKVLTDTSAPRPNYGKKQLLNLELRLKFKQTILYTVLYTVYCTILFTKMAYSFRKTTFPVSSLMYCILYCTLYYTT